MKIYNKEEKPIIYLSGGHTSVPDQVELDWFKRTGCRFRCYSFAYTCPGAFYYNKRMHRSLDLSLGKNIGIMMDSGAASFHKFVSSAAGGQISNKKQKSRGIEDVDKLKEETIERYIAYCKANKKDWDFYVTFDFIKHCPTIYKVTKRLEKEGLRPAPVFHGDMDLSWFERYCQEGNKIIGVGISYTAKSRSTWKGKRFYYDALFNIAEKYGVRLHGLAVTALTLMFQFPWYSVDSATWVKTAAYGKIIYVDKNSGVMPQLHISRRMSAHAPSYNNLPAPQQKRIRQMVEDYGFEFNKVRDDQHERAMFNAMIFSKHLHRLKEGIAATKVNWENLV